MFELLDLANFALPDNRREAAVLVCTLAFLLTMVFLGVFLHEANASSEPVAATYLGAPAWLRWGMVVAPAICVLAIAAYLADVAAENKLRRKVGTWPRRHPQGGT